MNAALCHAIFDRCIAEYHLLDDVDQPEPHPYAAESAEALLYQKAWIDTVQWHLEDLTRDPEASGEEVKTLKQRIDACNQRRTNTVERIDDWFVNFFARATALPDARLNSETPAWLIDRLSILALKVYHWREQASRRDAEATRAEHARAMLAVAEEQRADMERCLDELIEDIQAGRRYMKVYRQLKMYNDRKWNPVLEQRTSGAGG